MLDRNYQQRESGCLQDSLDWKVTDVSGVQVTRDSRIAHSGTTSLRIDFDGTTNVGYQHITQLAVVPPGRYRFSAFVRSDGVTTDEGVGVRILDAESPTRLMAGTQKITGTADWTEIDKIFDVPSSSQSLLIQVFREPSSQFANKIGGSVWIDTVSLTRVS